MSTGHEWTVRVAARALRPGTRFLFTDSMGGENQVVTVVTVTNTFGTTEVEVEELDFTISLLSNRMIEVL